MAVKISVIIPIYNKKSYMIQSLDSIVNQTYQDLEIILVDDGSTDGSSAICDEYAEMDERIHVIHQANGGVSAARNVGISAATGDYLSFVDADDFLEQNAYELFAQQIEKFRPDVLDCGLRFVSNGLKEQSAPQLHGHPKDCLLDKTYIVKHIVPALTNLPSSREWFIFDYTCNKLFRTEMIRANHILFDDSRRKWEDRPFVVKCIAKCQSYLCLSSCLYNYVGVPSSLSSEFDCSILNSVTENFSLYDTLFGQIYNYHTPEVYQIWAEKLNNVIRELIENHLSEHDKEIRLMLLDCLEDETVSLWISAWVPKTRLERQIRAEMQAQHVDITIRLYQKLIENVNRSKRRNLTTWSRIIRKLRKICSD